MSIRDTLANPIVIVGILGFITTLLTYRLSQKKDAVAAQSNIASNQIGAVGQVIDGLNQLVANIQSDNEQLREDIVALKKEYRELERRCEQLDKEFRKFRIESQMTK